MTALFTEADLDRLIAPPPRKRNDAHPEITALGAKLRAEHQAGDTVGALFGDADLEKLGIGVEEPRFRDPALMTPLQKAAALHVAGTGRITEGIDWKKRVGAGFKFDRQSVFNYLRDTYGADNVTAARDPNSGEVLNFVVKDKDGRLKIADPEGLDPGDVADLARDAAEVGPGVALGTAGTVLGGPLGGIAGGVIGDAIGSAGVQGVGKALPGSEAHVSPGARAVSAGVNVGAGLLVPAGGALLKGGARLVEKGAAKAGVKAAAEGIAKRELGEKLSEEALQQSARSIAPKTVGSYFDDSQRIIKSVQEAIADPSYGISAGKATGSKYALGVERTLAQAPATMEAMARQSQKELVGASRYADSIVEHIASNPDALGNAAVGENTAKAINRHIDNILEARSAAARPLYEKAESMFGGKRIVPTDETRGLMSDLIESNKFGPSKITSQMQEALSKIEAGGSDTGRLSITDMQNLRAMWNEVKRGDKTIVEGLSTRNQKRIADRVLKAIDSDLDAATKGIQGEAARTLQDANRVWAEHSAALNSVTSQSTVKRILKLGADAKNEDIVRSIGNLGREQLRNVMTIVEKTDPAGAADLRAQLLANIFESGGKPQAATRFGRELIEQGSESGIKPRTLQKAIVSKGDAIGDLFGRDVVTQQKVKDLVGLLDRLGAGPGWVGSDTVPKGIISGMLGLLKGAAPGVAGQGMDALRNAFARGVVQPETLLKIVADPEAAATAHVWLKPLLDPKKATPAMLGESAKALARLTALYGRDEALGGKVDESPSPRYEPQPRAIARGSN